MCLLDYENCKTPLSLACANGHLNLTMYFVEEQHIDPKGVLIDITYDLDTLCEAKSPFTYMLSVNNIVACCFPRSCHLIV